jgi:Flp pilus assembly protein TadG
MMIKFLSEKLSHALYNFSSADSGNVLITFTLALLPIMGVVGAAVDYSRANSDKAAMQAAIDATALWLSKNAATMTTAQLNQNATNHFNAVFTRTDVSNIAVTPTYTTSGGTQLVVTGTGSVPTKIMGLMGFSSLAINVSSTVIITGETRDCASLWCSTIPDRWQTVERLPRSRPPQTIS